MKTETLILVGHDGKKIVCRYRRSYLGDLWMGYRAYRHAKRDGHENPIRLGWKMFRDVRKYGDERFRAPSPGTRNQS